MTYKYALQKDVTELNKWCLDIIHNVQRCLKEYFTFDIRLVGSGEKRLVTMDSNGSFDLDYNLIIQRDKRDLINDPKAIKNLFIKAFKQELNKVVEGFNHVCDSTSVVKNKIIYNNKLQFKFDVAIMVKADNDSYYKLINDKTTNNYIWNQVKEFDNKKPISYISKVCHILNPHGYPLIFDSYARDAVNITTLEEFNKLLVNLREEVNIKTRKEICKIDSALWASKTK